MKLILTLFVSGSVFGSVYCGRFTQIEGRRTLIDKGLTDRRVSGGVAGITERSVPRYFSEHAPLTEERLVELCGPDQRAIEAELLRRNVTASLDDESIEGRDEVFTIVENGPSSNRIDLVFMGDGYLESEKDKFLADMKRLTHELFDGRTFASYLPIFNVYAVFRASNQSGIGKNDTPKDTAYKLYRLGNTLRAIYVGNSLAAHNSCSKAPGCDYPILIANDPYYGGLGGEFSISTSSPTSGMMVLRHELGHSVGDIGEEYDGGGYFGANHADSLGSIGWKHWLSGPIRAEPSQAREISWPWVNLAAGPFAATFTSDGLWSSVNLQLSVSGAQTDQDFLISLDGKPLPFQSPGHGDRDFHSFTVPAGLSNGTHELKFAQGVDDGDNWVSNISVHEFKSDYHFDPNYIGAYPMFGGTRAQGYRPTHDTCLMRNMKSDRFCPVCQENNWVKFFGSVEMIDSIRVVSDGKSASVVRVVTQPLGQFRIKNALDRVVITWLKNSQVVPEFQDKTEVRIEDTTSKWEVEVRFETPEVRRDPLGQLKTKRPIVF